MRSGCYALPGDGFQPSLCVCVLHQDDAATGGGRILRSLIFVRHLEGVATGGGRILRSLIFVRRLEAAATGLLALQQFVELFAAEVE